MNNFRWLRFLIVIGIPLSILVFTCCSASKKTILNASNTPPQKESGFNISNDGAGFRIGFYNVENLFDTEDDPVKIDSEYLPTSRLRWTEERYQTKQNNIAQVIKSMSFPSLLGLTEIENDKVLQDLVSQSFMSRENYGFIHFESPDERGIDVALLFKKADFTVKNSQFIRIKLPHTTDKTRDILQVTGILRGQPLTVFVNHFPSRRGDKGDSEDKRIYVAQQLRKAVDDVQAKDDKMGIIIMGDFNDDPTDISMSETLGAKPWTQDATIEALFLYNLAASIDKNTEGSLYYRGWSVFDQIIVSANLMDKTDKTETIFKKDFMVYKDKNGNELPNRTYTGPIYRGGYSDHFPVYVDMYLK